MYAATFASIGNFDFGNGAKLNRAELQSTFVPDAIANPFLILGNGVSAYDVGFRARGNDLILVYSGAVTNWFDGSNLRANGVLYRTEDRTQYGLAAGGPDVLVLPNWYLAASDSYVRYLLGGDYSSREFEDIARGLQREFSGDERDNTLTYGPGTYRVQGLGGNDTITT